MNRFAVAAVFSGIVVTGVFSGSAIAQQQNVDVDFGLEPSTVEIRRRAEDGLETVMNRDGSPIEVKLEPGVERRLVFPEPVMVGVQNGAASQLQIQNVDRTVYLIATGNIEHTRLLVRHVDESETYVLDVTTSGFEARHTALLINPVVKVAATQPSAPPATPRMRMKQRRDYTVYSHYARLTRFAAQQTYGPRRLAGDDVGVGATEGLDTTTPIALVRGDRVEAIPIASWTDGIYSVTALRLRNQTADTLILDPRDLRGRWLAATFHANSLGGAGDVSDTTAVYVISGVPFDQALGSVR